MDSSSDRAAGQCTGEARDDARGDARGAAPWAALRVPMVVPFEWTLRELTCGVRELERLRREVDAATALLVGAMPETRDSSAALARSCGVSGREAKRRRDVAAVARKVPRALELLASGEISAEHVAALVPVASLPGASGLLEGAGSRSPEELIAAAEEFRLGGEHGEDVARRQRARRMLRFFTAPDGMVGLSGLLPPLEGATLRARLAAIVDARWRTEHPERASTLGGHGGDTRDQRMADALLEITGVAEAPVCSPSDRRADDIGSAPRPGASAEQDASGGREDSASPSGAGDGESSSGAGDVASSSGAGDGESSSAFRADTEAEPERDAMADRNAPVFPSLWRPPTEVKTGKPAVVVVFDVDSWKANLLGYGPIPVTASLFDRVKADLYYSFTTMTGEVLKFGHARRDPTPVQRLAVIARDRHCIYPGCHAPPEHCEIHHVDEVRLDNGVTDVERLGLVCKPHHRHVHLLGLYLQRELDGSITVRRRDTGEPVTRPPNDHEAAA